MTDTPKRVSWEKLLLDEIRQQLSLDPAIEHFSGMAAVNRYDVPAWELTVLQRFQFGDLRIETPTTTLVVEAESAGGLTNLVKYWPLLEAKPPKRFVLIHVFHIGTPSDYIAHRKLWDYVVDRMRRDLEQRCGLTWPKAWEASIHTYTKSEGIPEIVERIRSVLSNELPADG